MTAADSTMQPAGEARTGLSPRGIRITKIVVAVSALTLVTLFALFVHDARTTNAFVARLRAFEPGTPFAEVTNKFGPPDTVDDVANAWKWNRRMVRVPPEVKHVAVYNARIAPQVCAFWLDEQEKIVAVEVFASY